MKDYMTCIANSNMTGNSGISESVCLICNIHLEGTSCVNIHYTALPGNGKVLASCIFTILHSITNLHSSYVCSQCYNLFMLLEQAQRSVQNIQDRIRSVYQSSQVKYTDVIKDNSNIRNDQNDDSFRDHSESNLQVSRCFNQLEHDVNNGNNEKTLIIPKDASTTPKHVNSSKNTNIIVKVITVNHHYQNLSQVPVEVDVDINNEDMIERNANFDNESNQSNFNDKKIVSTENLISSNSTSKLHAKNGMVGKKPKSNCKREYSCPTCGKICKNQSELNVHIKTHSTARPFICEKCGQAYKHKHAFEIHIGMHNGINPFQCCFCNKNFTQKGALIRHVPLHTGETPYKCELCDKKFVHHTSYKMHMLSHNGQKTHQCPICNLKLLSSSHLKRHMRVHTGEKSYTCSFCGKRFAERYNLLTHQKIHDSNNVMKNTKKFTVQM